MLKFKDKLMDIPEKIKKEVEKTIINKSEVYCGQKDRQFVEKEIVNLQSTKEVIKFEKSCRSRNHSKVKKQKGVIYSKQKVIYI
jgi:hypothetical protein